jgi:cell wall-associated NlpC family hydrolase
MSIIDDITSRIASLEQLFPALAGNSSTDASDPTDVSGAVGTPAVAFDSQLQSALAAEADPADSTGAVEQPGGGAAATTSSGSGSTGTAATSDGTSSAALSSASTSSTGSAGLTGTAVVTDAEKYIGVPYVYGGTNPAVGLDCSALVQRTYADLGVSLPRTSEEQSTQGTAVASLAQAQPGDLVCFNSPATHIGIYIGNNQMVVAPHTGEKVQIQTITKTPSSIRRIVGTSLDPTVSSSPSLSSAVLTGRPAALGGLGGTASVTTSMSSYPSGEAAYAADFTAAEQKYSLPTGLLSAVAKAESSYQPGAVSSAGAIGLMQLMPATASALDVDPTDPVQSIDGAAQLLKGELTKYGSVPLALAAYNAGGPAVDKYGGIPPYPETENYVQEIMGYLSGQST